jgi:hypothetical protein
MSSVVSIAGGFTKSSNITINWNISNSGIEITHQEQQV